MGKKRGETVPLNRAALFNGGVFAIAPMVIGGLLLYQIFRPLLRSAEFALERLCGVVLAHYGEMVVFLAIFLLGAAKLGSMLKVYFGGGIVALNSAEDGVLKELAEFQGIAEIREDTSEFLSGSRGFVFYAATTALLMYVFYGEFYDPPSFFGFELTIIIGYALSAYLIQRGFFFAFGLLANRSGTPSQTMNPEGGGSVTTPIANAGGSIAHALCLLGFTALPAVGMLMLNWNSPTLAGFAESLNLFPFCALFFFILYANWPGLMAKPVIYLAAHLSFLYFVIALGSQMPSDLVPGGTSPVRGYLIFQDEKALSKGVESLLDGNDGPWLVHKRLPEVKKLAAGYFAIPGTLRFATDTRIFFESGNDGAVRPIAGSLYQAFVRDHVLDQKYRNAENLEVEYPNVLTAASWQEFVQTDSLTGGTLGKDKIRWKGKSGGPALTQCELKRILAKYEWHETSASKVFPGEFEDGFVKTVELSVLLTNSYSTRFYVGTSDSIPLELKIFDLSRCIRGLSEEACSDFDFKIFGSHGKDVVAARYSFAMNASFGNSDGRDFDFDLLRYFQLDPGDKAVFFSKYQFMK